MHRVLFIHRRLLLLLPLHRKGFTMYHLFTDCVLSDGSLDDDRIIQVLADSILQRAEDFPGAVRMLTPWIQQHLSPGSVASWETPEQVARAAAREMVEMAFLRQDARREQILRCVCPIGEQGVCNC